MGTIAISEDEERFAFFADDSQSKSNLVVCKMGSDKKLKREFEIYVPFGDIKFNDNNSVAVTGIDGTIANYDLE